MSGRGRGRTGRGKCLGGMSNNDSSPGGGIHSHNSGTGATAGTSSSNMVTRSSGGAAHSGPGPSHGTAVRGRNSRSGKRYGGNTNRGHKKGGQKIPKAAETPELAAEPMSVDVPEEEETEHETLVMKVFQNELVFDTLGSFLNFGDFLALSLVSKRFYQVTRSHRPFTDRATFKLNAAGCNKGVYKPTTFPWKSVACYMERISGPPGPGVGICNRILHFAEHLEIHDHLEAKIASKVFLYFFTSSPELKSITLDSSILNRNLKSIFGKKAVIERFTNLEKFAITAIKDADYSFIDCLKFGENIRLLLKIPWNLQSLAFEKLEMESDIAVNLFIELVEKNRESLRELILHGNLFRGSQLKTIICPFLSKLDVTVRDETEPDLVEFLKGQPHLTSLSVKSRDGIRKDLLVVIEQRCSKLLKLRLKTPFFIMTQPPPPPQPNDQDQDMDDDNPPALPDPIPVDFSFLGGINTLVEFELVQMLSRDYVLRREHCVTIAEALSALPNERVKSLSFGGMYAGWVGDATLAGIAAFSRFQNLIQLSLLDCDDTLNNEILQFIFSNFARLKVFQVAKSVNITAVGLTGLHGENEVNTGISLKNLKNLHALTLVNCERLENEDYLHAIEFLELTKLDLRPSVNLSVEQILQVIRRNPSLQYLCLDNVYGEDQRIALNAQMKEISTRLKPEYITYKPVTSIFSPAGSDVDSDEWSDDYGSSVSGDWGWEHDDGDNLDFDDLHGYGYGSDDYGLDFGDSDSVGSDEFEHF